MNENPFTGYVLAGGKSSRMGLDKALLRIGEKTFLENAVETLKPFCRRVKIVLNRSQKHLAEKVPNEVSCVFDTFEDRGALGGIHAAFRDCETEFAVVLAVDMPFVTGEAVEKLCEIISAEKSFSAVVPRQADGKLQPVCAVYRPKDCLTLAESQLSEERSFSLKAFLDKCAVNIVDQKTLTENENAFRNVNTPKDYESLKRRS